MSTINLNDATPAAPANFSNVKFQNDASGNVSAYWSVGAWINYTPTVTPTAPMTISNLAIPSAEYLRMGPIIFYKIALTFTLGGTASNTISISLPTLPVAPLTVLYGSAMVYDTGWGTFSVVPGTQALLIRPWTNTTGGGGVFALTATQIMVLGFYHG